MNLKEFLAMDGAVEDDSLYARLVKAAKGKINRDNTGRGGNTPKNQSLEQHDKRFHPQGYEKGDTCKFREKLGEESSPDDLSEKNTDLDVNNSGSNGDDLYAKVYGMSKYEDDLDSFEYDIKKIPNGATKESLGITDPSVQGVVGKYVGESGSIDDANYFLRHDISNIVHNTNHAYKDQGLELGVVSGKDGTYLVLKKASTAANGDDLYAKVYGVLKKASTAANGDDLYAKVYGMSEYEDDLDSFEYDIKKIPNGATKESLGITDPSVQGVVGKYVGESGSIDDANYFLRHDISNIVHNTNHAYKDQGLELGVVSGKDGTYLVLKKASTAANGDDLYAKVYGMSEYEDDLDSFEYDIKKIPNGATKESLGITDPSVQGVVGKYVGESGSIDDANYFLRHDISNIVHNTNHAYKDQGLELGVVSGKDGTYLVLKKASTAANSDVTKSGRKGLTYTATKCNSQGEFDDLMRGAFMRYGDDEFWMEDVSEDEPFFKKMEELNPEYMDAWKDYQAKRNGAKSKWSRNTPAQKYIDSVNKRYSYPSQSSGSASSSENAQGDEKTKEMYLEAKKDFKNVASEFSRKGFKGIRHEKHPEVIKAASDFLTRIGLDPNGKDLQKDHDFSNNLDAMAFMLTDAALTDEFKKEYLHEIQDLIRSGIAKGKGAK